MRIKVRLFAAARQLATAEYVEVELCESATIADLRAQMAIAYPALRAILSHAAFAINEAYASNATKLAPRDDIACIPPVSGG